MANSFTLDTLRQAILSQKFVRAAVRVRGVHRMRHHLSALALNFRLDFGRRRPRCATHGGRCPPCRNLTASPQNCQPSDAIARVLGRRESCRAGRTCYKAGCDDRPWRRWPAWLRWLSRGRHDSARCEPPAGATGFPHRSGLRVVRQTLRTTSMSIWMILR